MANPPIAAVPVKAWVKMEPMVGIRLPMFSTMISRPKIRYPRLITGTSFTNILLRLKLSTFFDISRPALTVRTVCAFRQLSRLMSAVRRADQHIHQFLKAHAIGNGDVKLLRPGDAGFYK